MVERTKHKNTTHKTKVTKKNDRLSSFVSLPFIWGAYLSRNKMPNAIRCRQSMDSTDLVRTYSTVDCTYVCLNCVCTSVRVVWRRGPPRISVTVYGCRLPYLVLHAHMQYSSIWFHSFHYYVQRLHTFFQYCTTIVAAILIHYIARFLTYTQL